MNPPRPVFRLGWAVHRALHRLSGGRLGTQAAPPDHGLGTLFLVSQGRTTGKVRRNGLFYVPDGPSFVVVASNAGADVDPSWWRNLQTQPDAEVVLGRTTHRVRARRATTDERARSWPRFVDASASYADYERKTTREIPVVVLEPR